MTYNLHLYIHISKYIYIGKYMYTNHTKNLIQLDEPHFSLMRKRVKL